MARQGEPFDEIMIVNPSSQQGGKRMRFIPYPVRQPSLSGYFAEVPEQMGYYSEVPETVGYVYEAPETMGYYAEAPETMGHYGSPYGVGYMADPPPEEQGLNNVFDQDTSTWNVIQSFTNRIYQ